MSNSTYSDSRLAANDIRLAKLLPGAWSDAIRCRLFRASLDDAKYHALSYVWGSQNVTRSILLDDRPFAATVNLEGALRHLRHQHENGLVLWIDALCINQEDMEERTHQVQLMGKIYKSCVSTIVYLGDGSWGERSKHYAPTVTRFHNDARDVSHQVVRHLKDPSKDSGVLLVFCLIRTLALDQHFESTNIFSTTNAKAKPFGDRTSCLEILRKIMNPPWTAWWQRIWVVQEITMPRHVTMVYGSVSAPWGMFARAALSFNRHLSSCCSSLAEAIPRDELRVLVDFSDQIWGIEQLRTSHFEHAMGGNIGSETPRGEKTMLSLLQQFRGRKASDPRDKVYALLSLVPPGGTELLPDYSLSVEEVFRKATLDILKVSGSLLVLSTDIGRKFRSDLPTWVPDWDAPGGLTDDMRAAGIGVYSPNRSNQHQFATVPTDHSYLEVRALNIDIVVWMGEVMWGDSAEVCQNTIRQWWAAYRRLILEPSRKCSKDSFWRVLCADLIYPHASLDSNNVRRATNEDEINFVSWALTSKRSPFHQLDEAADIVDQLPEGRRSALY
jgi:hypothetical protein